MEGGEKNPRVLALFDVDGTLTEPRKLVSPETLAFLAELRSKIATGVVGGSDLTKQKEQLGDSPALFDWCFAENGLLAHKDGSVIGQMSLVKHLGEDSLKRLINWVLAYLSTLDIPVKRGTFIEFRQGMLNISPIGRNCNREERNDFEKFDLANKIRETMVAKMRTEFKDLNLTYSIGGQISFDVFPQGWDKTVRACVRVGSLSLAESTHLRPRSPSLVKELNCASCFTAPAHCSFASTICPRPTSTRSTSSVTRPSRAATTSRFLATREPKVIRSMTRTQ